MATQYCRPMRRSLSVAELQRFSRRRRRGRQAVALTSPGQVRYKFQESVQCLSTTTIVRQQPGLQAQIKAVAQGGSAAAGGGSAGWLSQCGIARWRRWQTYGGAHHSNASQYSGLEEPLISPEPSSSLQAAIPKQYLTLSGIPIAVHSLLMFASMPEVREIIIVCEQQFRY